MIAVKQPAMFAFLIELLFTRSVRPIRLAAFVSKVLPSAGKSHRIPAIRGLARHHRGRRENGEIHASNGKHSEADPQDFWAVALLLSLAAGCAKTVAEQSAVIKQVESGDSAASGFFGSDASLLQPGQEGQAAMVYINSNAHWSQYDKIMLEPVQFWDSANSTVSPSDQHTLTAYAYNKLKEDLQKDFTLVDQGGPAVLVLQVALVNATAATPGLR